MDERRRNRLELKVKGVFLLVFFIICMIAVKGAFAEDKIAENNFESFFIYLSIFAIAICMFLIGIFCGHWLNREYRRENIRLRTKNQRVINDNCILKKENDKLLAQYIEECKIVSKREKRICILNREICNVNSTIKQYEDYCAIIMQIHPDLSHEVKNYLMRIRR